MPPADAAVCGWRPRRTYAHGAPGLQPGDHVAARGSAVVIARAAPGLAGQIRILPGGTEYSRQIGVR